MFQIRRLLAREVFQSITSEHLRLINDKANGRSIYTLAFLLRAQKVVERFHDDSPLSRRVMPFMLRIYMWWDS